MSYKLVERESKKMTKPLLLIVDDEPDMAEFVGDVGDQSGFDVLIATSAREFQDLYLSKNPFAIVMDIVMPGMDGIELINWLCENDCNAYIIFMTGYDSLYIETAKKLGSRKGCRIIGTLTKPFTESELEPLLQQIFHY